VTEPAARGEPPPGPPWDGPVSEAPLLFIDLEMTGLDAKRDRVIEICAQRVRGEVVEASLDTLLHADGAFGNEHVHKISRAALDAAPSFSEVLPWLSQHLEGAVLVAHAAAWDVSFLEAELARAGAPRTLPHWLDTLTLARRAFSLQSHSMGALCEHFGIQRQRAHRASDDVLALRAVWARCLQALAPRSLRDLWHVRVGRRHARPELVAEAVVAADLGYPVQVRYRPARKGRAARAAQASDAPFGPGVEELEMVITAVRTDLDPPRVLGYLLPSRGRRELRADRILAIVCPPPIASQAAES
jgi:DNA polymerase III subunit epsilon